MAQGVYEQAGISVVVDEGESPTGWTGWISFAGVMMIIGGSLNALYGFIGIVNDDWVVWYGPG